MQIESHGPFRTETILWQPSHGTHALTVICKATFMLTPGTMEVAVQEEPIHSIDDHWDDDVHRSVRAPSDMVPMKPSADVVVVGYAHAPEARPVRSLVARLAVGDIDKRIDVFGERYWTEMGNCGKVLRLHGCRFGTKRRRLVLTIQSASNLCGARRDASLCQTFSGLGRWFVPRRRRSNRLDSGPLQRTGPRARRCWAPRIRYGIPSCMQRWLVR